MKEFFDENHPFLEENYPGIHLKRLNDEFSFFQITAARPLVFFDKLKKGIPLEYITCHKYFYNHDFYIDTRVLIPRFDSEPMLFEAISFLKKKQDTSFCEIGVGSGCLCLSLLKELSPQIKKVLVTDISSEALEVFDINFLRLKYLFTKTELVTHLGDRLFGIEEKFDLIMTNPPYIPLKYQALVHANVHQFEPSVALYLEDELYARWFDLLFKQVYDCLKHDGMFLMEGHELMLDELAASASELFSQVEIKEDLTNRKRYLKISK